MLFIDLLLVAETGGAVHGPAGEADDAPGKVIADGARRPVRGHDVEHLRLRVAVVRPRCGCGPDVLRLLGGEEVAEAGGRGCGEMPRQAAAAAAPPPAVLPAGDAGGYPQAGATADADGRLGLSRVGGDHSPKLSGLSGGDELGLDSGG